jgi:hypothetical protein
MALHIYPVLPHIVLPTTPIGAQWLFALAVTYNESLGCITPSENTPLLGALVKEALSVEP